MEHLQSRSFEHLMQTVVRILIHDDHAEVWVRLELERGEEMVELAHATDRRYDEVERWKRL
jgi:hypothetical protein